MLVSVATVLARSTRARIAAALITVDTADLLEVAVQAISKTKRPAIISISADHHGHILLDCARAFAHHTEAAIALEFVSDTAQAVSLGSLGPVALRLIEKEGTSQAQFTRTCSETVQHGLQEGIEVIAELHGYQQPNKLAQFCRESGVVAVLIDSIAPGKGARVNPAHLKELAVVARVPIIGDTRLAAEVSKTQAFTYGVHALQYDMQSIHEAYVAGLRTGLRNRSQAQVRAVTHTAHVSAEQALERLLI